MPTEGTTPREQPYDRLISVIQELNWREMNRAGLTSRQQELLDAFRDAEPIEKCYELLAQLEGR